ncbi:MAG: hypothetical protein DMG76_26980, partial [Acidobacteria bacterium]
ETVLGGPYHITATLAPAAMLTNYTITNTGASFTINARPATWTTNANSKTYGSSDLNPLTTGSGDFLVADGVTATYSRAAGETVQGGPYHITATLAPAAVLTNYAITNTGASFTINARPATWTTNANSKTYGTSDGNPLTTGSGDFLAADGVTATYSRAAGETVLGGPYHITATLAPAAMLTNYTITNTGASFTINARPATWTTNANSKTYGSSDLNPATYSGFVLGQGPSSLSGTLSCTTTATTNSPVGSYTINCSGQTSTNYTITYVSSTLTITYVTSGMCAGDVGHQIRQPINADGSSVWKQGSTAPAKFAVCDANGVSIGTAAVVTSFSLVAIIHGTMTTVDEAPASTTPDTAFRWDPTGQQWIFNISTKSAPVNVANQTYMFQILLNDGSTINFQFGLK